MSDTPGPADLLALTDRCVQCGLCLPHCPTYRLDQSEAESPRGRIAYAKAVATGRLQPTTAGDTHLDHCLGCLRCETVCPAGVEYGSLLDLARAGQRQRRPPDWRQRGIEWLAARPVRSAAFFGLWGRVGALVPQRLRPLPLPAARGSRAAKCETGDALALFPGCVGGIYEAGLREKLATLLAQLDYRVTEIEGASCCGALSRHAGAAAAADRQAADNRQAYAAAGRVLCLASGCQAELERALAGVAVVEDALVFLSRHRDRLRARQSPYRTVALHLPCTQRRLEGSALALRGLLEKIPELEVIELPDTGCCGAAGTHMLHEPQRAARLRDPLLQAFAASGAEVLLSANLGCRLHLADRGRVKVLHPLELIVCAHDVESA